MKMTTKFNKMFTERRHEGKRDKKKEKEKLQGGNQGQNCKSKFFVIHNYCKYKHRLTESLNRQNPKLC